MPLMRPPRNSRLICVLACLIMAVSTAPALASWGLHTGFRAENGPTGLAAAGAGNVYVDELLFGLNHEFSLEGELISPAFPVGGGGVYSGVAVNPVNHNVYVVHASAQTIEAVNTNSWEAEHSFSIAGTANLFGAYTVVEIAADAHGNVYVPNEPGNRVEVFDEEGNAPQGSVEPPLVEGVHAISGEGEHALKAPRGVGIGPEDNVWVADTGDNRIEEFEPNGTFIKEIASPAVEDVAVEASGDVFASDGGAEPEIIEYDAKGTPIDHIGKGVLRQATIGETFEVPKGLVADETNEIIDVAEFAQGEVVQFLSWGVITGMPTNVGETQATLHGTVEVEAGTEVPSCEFEYVTQSHFASEGFKNPATVACEQPGPYTSTTLVSATASLTPGVDYRYRIAETSRGFKQVGEAQPFGPPAVDSEFVEAGFTTATPRARVTIVEEGASTCKVQYVDEAAYVVSGFNDKPSEVSCTKPIGTKPGEYYVETATITGLPLNSVYHYRFLTTSHAGTSIGADEEFGTFGIKSFAFAALDEAGQPFAQAAGHPYQWTDKFTPNTSAHRFVNGTTDPVSPDANAKDVITELPPGLIGNPQAVPKCEPYNVERNRCGGASQVGVIKVSSSNPGEELSEGHPAEYPPQPIYNVVPPRGTAAQFAANVENFAEVRIDAKVRTGGDYGVTAEVLNSSAEEGLVSAEVTLWGVPAAGSHDTERFCPSPSKAGEEAPCQDTEAPRPFLTDPTACTGESTATTSVDSWQDPSLFVSASTKMPPFTGCHEVPFTPSIKVTPESSVSDSPTGLHVELTVPQQENPFKLAEADLKDAAVTLPAGMTVNPSSANGMVGCPLLEGTQHEQQESEGKINGINMHTRYAANCPEASKIGSVHIKTPLLEEELVGGVYVAQQSANPFKSLLALYIAAEAPERGVVIKLAGQVSPNPITGQLTTTFNENPQLPFERLRLDFFGGERAPLATPFRCGSYTTATLLEPWSHQPAAGEAEGTANATPSSEFKIESRCTHGFSPSLTAGTSENKAAAFSPFVMTLTRNDGEQRLSTVAMTMPKGLAGMLSKVPLCAEAQANAGSCPAASKIGHVIVQAGVGDEPVTLPQAGEPEDPVYLTGPYKGAPFGLSVVVPAEAGPFNLGTVVVRAKIEIDPHTGQVSVLSNPMPTILQGIPLDVKAIHVEVDKPGFIFNPTSCQPSAVTGTIGSAEGAFAALSSHFQAADCAALPFKPKFSTVIHAHHSRADGEYMHVIITSAFGQASLAKVHVQLPAVLPSRLETLKLACTEAQFAKNPAGCPAGSVVGTVTVQTPILPVPLTGPAIFVSHGGAGFPNLDFVLQGDGVTIIQVGQTFINKKSITTSSFNEIPDVPVSRVDVVLPAGPHSALAGQGDLCAHPLYMPTKITGQNGALLEQKTRIKVQGCKPQIRVLSHSIHGDKASIRLSVPSAGTLHAGGRELIGAHKRVRKAGEATIAVSLSKQARALLTRHASRRLKVRIHLRLTRPHTQALTTSLTVLMR